jgi:predicted ester cyclase
MMSLEKNKAIARRYQEEVWGKGNLALIDELLAPDYVDHSLPATMDPGFAGAKRAVQGALDAFPDGQWTVEDLIVEGEKVAIRWKMRATHEHAFRGIVDGKIVERWVNWDSLVLRQPSETVNIGAV